MSTPDCILEFKVRDYECDMQGVVNNAVYLNYLEHARHEFLSQKGVNFRQLVEKGIHVVAVRYEIHYKLPLVAGDHFIVESCLGPRSKLKIHFTQWIKHTNGQTVLQAHLKAAAVNRDRKLLRVNDWWPG